MAEPGLHYVYVNKTHVLNHLPWTDTRCPTHMLLAFNIPVCAIGNSLQTSETLPEGFPMVHAGCERKLTSRECLPTRCRWELVNGTLASLPLGWATLRCVPHFCPWVLPWGWALGLSDTCQKLPFVLAPFSSLSLHFLACTSWHHLPHDHLLSHLLLQVFFRENPT